jgi:hypothetical protein
MGPWTGLDTIEKIQISIYAGNRILGVTTLAKLKNSMKQSPSWESYSGSEFYGLLWDSIVQESVQKFYLNELLSQLDTDHALIYGPF